MVKGKVESMLLKYVAGTGTMCIVREKEAYWFGTVELWCSSETVHVRFMSASC